MTVTATGIDTALVITLTLVAATLGVIVTVAGSTTKAGTPDTKYTVLPVGDLPVNVMRRLDGVPPVTDVGVKAIELRSAALTST